MAIWNEIYAYKNTTSAGVSYGVKCYITGHHAAKFPKYVNVKNGTGNSQDGSTEISTFFVDLSSIKGNQRNDAGFKRLQKFLEIAKKEGILPEERAERFVNQVDVSEVLAQY